MLASNDGRWDADEAHVGALSLDQKRFVDALAVETRPRREAMAAAIERRSKAQRKLVFNDDWLSPEDCQRHFRRLRNQQIRQMLEIILFALGCIGFGLACLGMLLILYW